MNHLLNDSVAALNSLGGRFCDHAGSMFIQAGMLIVALSILDLLLRKRIRATFRYWMWMLVFVKLLLPSTLSLPTGVGYWLGDYSHAAPIAANAPSSVTPLKSAEITAPPVIADAPDEPVAGAAPDSVIATATSSSPAAPRLDVLTWQGVLFGLWILGVLAISSLLVQRVFFVRGLIAQSEPAESQLVEVLNQCRRQLGLRQETGLRLSPNVTSPAVCGLFHPAILIHKGILERLSQERLRAVLIHELAHIKRDDLWVNCVQTFLQIVYFYNPFVWLANAVVRRIREQAVDEMVLVALGAEAGSYSDTLIDVAEIASSRPALSLRLVGVVESKKALSARIKHIISRPTPRTARLGILGLLTIVLAAAVLLPMAKAEKQANATSAAPTPEQFVATLPDGVTVELVGVCEHPSEGKQWWRPDGSVLETTPYASIGAKVYGGQPYEFAVRMANVVDEKIDSRWAFGSSATHAGGHHPIDKNGKQMKDLWAVATGITKDIEKVTVKFGISSGKWQTQVTCDGKGSSHLGRGGYGFNFSLPYVRDNHTYIVVSDSMIDVPYRVVAIDKDGQIHEADDRGAGTAANVRQSEFGFNNLPIQNIREFQFQTRPYHWVTFKNVSLQPGLKTDVQIEIGEGQSTTDSAKKIPPDRNETSRPVVRAIIHGEGHRYAVIGTRVLKEGDEVFGATITTINPQSVVFEKDGGKWTQEIEMPSEKYPTIPSAVNAAKEGDMIALDVSEQNRSEVNIRKSNKYLATLPNGVTVELLGVCDIPSKGKQWWSADGSILENVFWDGTSLREENTVKARQVVFSISSNQVDPRTEPTIWFNPKRTRIQKGPSWSGAFVVTKDNRTTENLRGCSFSLANSQDSIDISATVGYGEWKTQAIKTIDSYGALVSGLTEIGTLIFNDPVEKDGKTTISVTLLNRIKAWRIIAIDKQGEIHNADSAVSSGLDEDTVNNIPGHQLCKAEISIPLNQVTEFQFQNRKVETVIFKNVSLEAGVRTDVRIEAEKPDVLRMPPQKYPTVPAAVEGVKDGDTIALDVSKPNEADPNMKKPPQYAATLPDGVKVELVGVCEHPSKGKQWWRPDGTAIQMNELPDYDYDDAVTVRENEYPRLLAFRLDDAVVQNAGISWSLKDAGESRFAPAYTDEPRTKRRSVQVILATFPQTLKSTDLRLGIAAGSWNAVASGTHGRAGAHTIDSIKRADVIYDKAREENGCVHISATHLLGPDYDNRIYAIGQHDEVFEPRQYSNPGREMRRCESEFDVSLEKVKFFYLQARPFQWVTFRNISLQPGLKTDVEKRDTE